MSSQNRGLTKQNIRSILIISTNICTGANCPFLLVGEGNMAIKQLAKLETDLHNAQARQFRRDISQVERQRLQEKVAWLKQRISEVRRSSRK
jgi:hypothetical protein